MKEHDVPPPFFFIGEHEIMAIVVLLLMFGANLGIKNYIRSRDDRKRLVELEKQNLEQQLEYLRYQINPHFFMNTLNNIHALVDFDPVKAQDTVLELAGVAGDAALTDQDASAEECAVPHLGAFADDQGTA